MIKKPQPLVTVIIPTFNPGNWFHDSLNGVLNQTYENFEVIVIDDGSQFDISQRFPVLVMDKRVRLLQMTKNLGGGRARNFGLRHARGNFIAFCDSDDIWPSDKLMKQINYMMANQYSITHTDLIRKKGVDELNIRSSDVIDLDSFLSNTDLYCSTVIVDKNIIGSASFGKMKARHPFKFWVNILERGFCSVRCPDIAVWYLVREKSVSSNKSRMIFYTLAAYFLYVRNKKKMIKGIFERTIQAVRREVLH